MGNVDGILQPCCAISYKLRYIVGFGLVEMAISTNLKSTMYRNLFEKTDPGPDTKGHVLLSETVVYFHLLTPVYIIVVNSVKIYMDTKSFK